MTSGKMWRSALITAVAVNAVGWGLYSILAPKEHYAYVDVLRLTQAYQLKTDLEQRMQQQLQPAKNLLDSLQFQASLQTGLNAVRVQEQYREAAYRYQEAQQAADVQLSQQVWDRLNPAIAAFSKEQRLKLLVGATGTGTLLYGDSTLDLTTPLIHYVNAKYKGQ